MRRLLFLSVLAALGCQDVGLQGPDGLRPPALSVVGGASQLVYVANRGGTVDVIDVATNTVVTTIDHGIGDAGPEIDISPDGTVAYVALGDTDQILVLDLATNTVSGTIPVGDNPDNTAFTPDGTRAYVPNVSSFDMSVIDVASSTVLTTIALGSHPQGVSITPDGRLVVVPNSVDHELAILDAATNGLIATVPITPAPTGPHATAITPDGTRALTANYYPGTVSVVDLAAYAVTATILVGGALDPNEVSITNDGTEAWVALRQSHGVAVIDLATYAVIAGIPLGHEPGHIAFTSDDALAYVAVTGLNVVKVFDVASRALVTTIPTGARPTGIAVTPDPDAEGPVTSGVTATANPVPVNGAVTLSATVDDAVTGGSAVGGAEYSLAGPAGPWTPMSAVDGTLDELSEVVEAVFDAPAVPGVDDLCVRGTDARGNIGEPECILFVSYDPDGGFVTGGGWIDSPVGAYAPDPALTGKANFGFVSRYRKGANVPTGTTEFHFKAGDLSFQSSSYEWLVVSGNHTANFKGSGTIDGSGDYRFRLWAQDDTVDTFRIRIWTEDEFGAETAVYDNGVHQPIGGGSIVIHDK